MRSKKKREEGEADDSRDGLERPMSWEGELSDSEMPVIKQVKDFWYLLTDGHFCNIY